MWWLALALSCSDVADRGVYRSGRNAAARYHVRDDQPILMWGPEGTVSRSPTPAENAFTLFGASGPLWIVDKEIAAEDRRAPVTAAIAERAGFRMREVLGGTATTEIDPARSAGVALRSLLKVRRHLAPPVYVAVATKGQHGIPDAAGKRSPVVSPEDCISSIAILDAELAGVLDHKPIELATQTCAVPQLAGPIDLDGDGVLDVLVHGQAEHAGFRNWFAITTAGTLAPGPSDHQTEIP